MSSNFESARIVAVNAPSWKSEATRRRHEALVSRLDQAAASFLDNNRGAVKSLEIGLSYNRKLNNVELIELGGTSSIVEFNFPRNAREEDMIGRGVMLTSVQSSLREFWRLQDLQARYLTVFVVYNGRIADLNLPDTVAGVSSGKQGLDPDEAVDFEASDPKYTLNQLVLSDSLRQEIELAVLLIEKQNVIYGDWGFESVDPRPRAILNLLGPPGTGKTSVAHGIAAKLGRKILVVHYADVESKFVGVAPKLLRAAFAQASRINAVLFFDEADSFLGRRISNPSSGSEQAINSLRSQLLVLMDDFKGLILLATNKYANYDEAFESRILRHLKFELPDSRARADIIRKLIPDRVPLRDGHLDSQEIDRLVQFSEDFAGRDIKNAVLRSLTLAVAADRDTLFIDDFVAGFEATRQLRDVLRRERSQRISAGERQALENRIKTALQDGTARHNGTSADGPWPTDISA